MASIAFVARAFVALVKHGVYSGPAPPTDLPWPSISNRFESSNPCRHLPSCRSATRTSAWSSWSSCARVPRDRRTFRREAGSRRSCSPPKSRPQTCVVSKRILRSNRCLCRARCRSFAESSHAGVPAHRRRSRPAAALVLSGIAPCWSRLRYRLESRGGPFSRARKASSFTVPLSSTGERPCAS